MGISALLPTPLDEPMQLMQDMVRAQADTSAARNRTARDPGRATFQNVTAGTDPIPVHFNPVSLQLALANTLDDSHSGGDRTQYVSKSSAKLTMDLIFDSTDTGANVREATSQVATFMEPAGEDQSHRTPPTVLFEWGAFKFQGILESYRETIDFFSHDGVPLRAAVNVTMSRQSVVFDDRAPSGQSSVSVPQSMGNASEIASRGGNPDAGRSIASANGLESMRFSTKAVSVSASVGVSASAGISAGGGLGIGVGVSASAGGSIGGSASAGLSASEGAFAGLRAVPANNAPIDPTKLAPRPQPRAVASGPQASFGIGGQAISTGSASLGTDVGTGTPQSRVRFDGGR